MEGKSRAQASRQQGHEHNDPRASLEPNLSVSVRAQPNSGTPEGTPEARAARVIKRVVIGWLVQRTHRDWVAHGGRPAAKEETGLV